MCSQKKYCSHIHVWIIRKEKSSFVRSLLKNSPLLMCAQGLLCCICYNFFVFSSFKIFMLKHRKWGFWTGFSIQFSTVHFLKTFYIDSICLPLCTWQTLILLTKLNEASLKGIIELIWSLWKYYFHESHFEFFGVIVWW